VKKQKAVCMLALAIFTAMPAAGAKAEVFMRHRIHIDAFRLMGKEIPEQVVIQKTWVGRYRIRTDNSAQSVLLLLDRKMLYFIDHKEKSYAAVRIDLDRIVKETALFRYPDRGKKEKGAGEQKEMIRSVTVKKTGDLKVIRGWKCEKYILTADTGMGTVKSEIWATSDIPFKYGRYGLYSAALISVMPGKSFPVEEAVREIEKIRNISPVMRRNMARAAKAARLVRGVPVYTETGLRVMDSEMRTSRELIEFRRGNAPGGTFSVPAGYTRKKIPGKN